MREVLPERLEQGRRAGDKSWGPYGKFFIRGPEGATLCIVASGADADDTAAEGWEHVSVSAPRRCPTWTEMCFVKDLFWHEEETVIQYHPPKSQYVNNHPYVLHLWRFNKVAFPTPPTILVGIKDLGVLSAAECSVINRALGRSP